MSGQQDEEELRGGWQRDRAQRQTFESIRLVTVAEVVLGEGDETRAFGAAIEQARLKGLGDGRRALRGDRALARQPRRGKRLRDPLDGVALAGGRCVDERTSVSIDP